MQRTYGLTFDVSRPGFLQGLGVPRVRAYRNSSNFVAEKYTIAIPATVDNNKTYQVIVDSWAAEYRTSANATQLELRDGLLSSLRISEIYDVFNPTASGNVITLTARTLGISHAVAVNGAETTNDLVLTKTATATQPKVIPFGRYVARKAGDPPDEARLPNALTDKLRGIAQTTYANEKTGIGPHAISGYIANDVMDVLDRCNECDGIWVECVEFDLTVDDVPYVSIDDTNGNAGKITRVSTGTIPAIHAEIAGNAIVNSDNSRMVLISINHP